MPREIVKKPRFIYPQIATSLTIAGLSMSAELLFWRILPQADDQGRLSGDSRQLKAIACPMRDEMTPEKIAELLNELEKADLIIHYMNSTQHYVQIKKWWDYQSAMRRIFPSHYPPPNGWRDRIKDVSIGQPPATADKQRPEEEEEKEPELETRIRKPEQEEEVTATPATETAMKSRTAPDSETHEGTGKAVAAVTAELELLSFLETLEGWRFGRADDLAWLREFCQEYPEFNLSLAKACRDYHSGRAPPKHKGHWKNRFRQWAKHERHYQEERHGRTGEHRQDTQRDTRPHDWEELPEDADFSR